MTQPLAGGVAPLDRALIVATGRGRGVLTDVAGAAQAVASVARGLQLVLAGSEESLLALEVALEGVGGLTLALQIIRVVRLEQKCQLVRKKKVVYI